MLEIPASEPELLEYQQSQSFTLPAFLLARSL